MSDLLEIMTKTPYGWPLMAPAYFGLVRYLAGEEGARQAFKEHSGMSLDLLVCKSPMDQMINEATGVDQKIVGAWLDWVTEFHWGEEDSVTPHQPRQKGERE